MKKNFIYLFMAAFVVCVFNSCSENDATKDDLVGTWNLRHGDGMDMVWESSEIITIDGLKLPTSAIAVIAADYSNEQLREEMRSLTFKANDDLEVTYKDEAGGWKMDVIGKYKVVGRTKFLFYPNIEKLFGEIGGMDVAEIDSDIKTLASTAGLPARITFVGQNATSARFYLETNTLKEAKGLVSLLFRLIAGDSVDAAIYEVLDNEMPGLLEKTDKIEIGFNFDKAAG